MSKSHRSQQTQQTSSDSDLARPDDNLFEQAAAYGNQFLLSLMGQGQSESPQMDAMDAFEEEEDLPMPEHLSANVAAIRSADGGTLIDLTGEQLRDLNQYDIVNERWLTTIGHAGASYEGVVWERRGATGARLWFKDLSKDQAIWIIKKQGRAIDLIAQW